MADIHIAIMAAGKGTRMRSELPKVLHAVAGLPLIEHVLTTAKALAPRSIVVVVGHMADQVRTRLDRHQELQFALQEPQLGTGHAVLQIEPFLAGAQGTLVVLSGDVPLLRSATLTALVDQHTRQRAAATVLTAIVDDPAGYGRIVRESGRIAAIVEHRDASPAQRDIREINSGIYAFDVGIVFDALKAVQTANAQGEYYLTDLIEILRTRGLTVAAETVSDPREVLGINSRRDLADIVAIMNTTKIESLMAAGVTITDPSSTWIAPDVEVGPDTILHPNVYLEGRTRIGSRCELHSGVRLVDAVIGNDVVVNNFCVITASEIRDGARVGPFAHIRPQSVIGDNAHIGNFVELKKTTLGRGSKANHLSYLGDATIGDRVNIGAGAITCNYDGVAKHPTIIEDGAFIGSDSQLIAPVRVGKDAYVAAGSSISEDVPPASLAIGRGKQVNKEGWVARKKRP